MAYPKCNYRLNAQFGAGLHWNGIWQMMAATIRIHQVDVLSAKAQLH